MSELHALPTDRGRVAADGSDRMQREAALVAGRLGEVLDGLPSLEDELPGGLSFVESFRAAVLGPEPTVEGPAGVASGGPRRDRHPLDRIVNGFDLSKLEKDVLVLAGLPEEHEGFGSILRTLHPEGEPRPTVGLAAQLFRPAVEKRNEIRAVLSTGGLVGSGAVVIRGSGPFFTRSLVPAPALWPALHGLDAWPEELRIRKGRVTTAGLDGWLSDREVLRALEILERGEPWTIVLRGRSPKEAGERGSALVRAAGGVPGRIVLSPNREDDVDRLATVHCVARCALPVVELEPSDGPPKPRVAPLSRFPGPVVACAASGALSPPSERRLLELRPERPSAAVRVGMWRELLPELDSEAPALAAAYRVNPGVAREAAEDARGRAALAGRPVEPDDVSAAVRSRTTAGVTEGATLRSPEASWDDLVLPEDRLARLREAVERVRHQARVLDDWGFLAGRPGSRGVRMLLAGPPGTGKTLSAEVVANALGVELLVTDVSRLVSKWIGETEKNLARIFDTAEEAQAVLLFDEADALFARRTEVADSNSRYANLETAYLLARMERFQGLTVLSTNLRRNVDSAFLRRLEFVVDYEEPGVEERRALWECHLPESAPLGPDVDSDLLAELYPMVGGHIRNAAVAAAFRAASDDGPIRQEHLVQAIRREHTKAGRAFPGVPSALS